MSGPCLQSMHTHSHISSAAACTGRELLGMQASQSRTSLMSQSPRLPSKSRCWSRTRRSSRDSWPRMRPPLHLPLPSMQSVASLKGVKRAVTAMEPGLTGLHCKGAASLRPANWLKFLFFVACCISRVGARVLFQLAMPECAQA